MLVNITSTILVNPKFISHIECVERTVNQPEKRFEKTSYPVYIITMVDGKKFEIHRKYDYPNEAYPFYALGGLLAKLEEGM